MKTSTGYAEQAVETRDVSAITRAREVLDNARSLASRLEDMASRLLGPVPQSAESAGGKMGGPVGLLGDLKEDAESTQRWLNDANHALSCIERAL